MFHNSKPQSWARSADLTTDQKAIIEILKQEGKTQKEISEQIGFSQSAVSRHLSGKSVGRKKCVKNAAQREEVTGP